MYFELQVWDGYSNHKRIVWEENYEAAVIRYASNLPPAYIVTLVPVEEERKSN